jgi:hypothetical protein
LLVDAALRSKDPGRAVRVASFVALLLSGGALFTLTVMSATAQQRTFEPRQEEPEEFPDFPGRDDTFYFCVACHNFKLVAQQGMSRQRWDGTLDLMTERHGMRKLVGKDRELILDYLAKAFPETEAPRGWQNPFLKR